MRCDVMGGDGMMNTAIDLYFSADAILRSSVKKKMASYLPLVWEHAFSVQKKPQSRDTNVCSKNYIHARNMMVASTCGCPKVVSRVRGSWLRGTLRAFEALQSPKLM
jgi:hypothetical protein